MKYLILLILLLFALPVMGANPAFQDFNSNQHTVTGNKVGIKRAAMFTNTILFSVTNNGHYMGGRANKINGIGDGLTIVSGTGNILNDNALVNGHAVILTGNGSTNSGSFSSILAGGADFMDTTISGSIISGSHNKMESLAAGNDSAIIGGSDHKIIGVAWTDNFIAGGIGCVLEDVNESAIIAGNGLRATNSFNTVLFGGVNNYTTAATNGVIGGGRNNRVITSQNFAIHGATNTIDNADNVVVHGFGLTVTQANRVVAGFGNANRADFTANGVGIGTNAPTAPLEGFGQMKWQGPNAGVLFWDPNNNFDYPGAELFLFGAQLILSTNESGVPGSIFVREGGSLYAESDALARTNYFSSAGVGSSAPNGIFDILQGPDNNVDASWRFGTIREFGPTTSTQNLASAANPIAGAWINHITMLGAGSGTLSLQNTNGVGAAVFTHTGPSSASNIFNFAGVTNPVAGQVLKVHSVSGNVVTLTNDTVGLPTLDTTPGATLGSDGSALKYFNYANSIHLVDEFIGQDFATHGSVLGWQNAANSGSMANAVAIDTNHWGIVALSTTTSASAAPLIYLARNGFAYGHGRLYGVFVFRFEDLSDDTENFQVRVGWSDSQTAAIGIDMAQIFYSHAATNNSGNFQFVTGNAGAYTTNNSAVAAAADTWYKLVIDGNAAGDSVVAYLNGTSIATNTTNIPKDITARSFGAEFQIIKTAGTTARLLHVDYFESVFLPSQTR